MVQKLRERIFLNYLTHTTQNKGQIVLAFGHIYYVGLESWLSKLKRGEQSAGTLTLEVKGPISGDDSGDPEKEAFIETSLGLLAAATALGSTSPPQWPPSQLLASPPGEPSSNCLH